MLTIIYILDAVVNLFKIFVYGNSIVQCLIKSLLVLLKIRFCSFFLSVKYMFDQIYCLESHEHCEFIVELCYVRVFNGLNYMVLEGLVHGCIIFKYLACFVICLIGLLKIRGWVICGNSWDWNTTIQVFPWCYHCQCVIQVFLHDWANMSMFFTSHCCRKGERIGI